MPELADNWLPTRTTLIDRLKNWEDDSSWTNFFELYGRLIFRVAMKSGLNPSEAEDVVQDTVLTVARELKGFRYDRKKGSFKSWLLTITRSRIVDRWRKSTRQVPLVHPVTETDSQTSFIERVPDSGMASEALWAEEWEGQMLHLALERLKAATDARHYQVFDCYVIKGWAPDVVAEKLKIKVEQVYIIKQRLTARLKIEAAKLEKEWA